MTMRLTACALIALLAFAAPSAALAHGGTVLVDENAGPYRLRLQAAPLAEAQTPGGAGAVDYTIELRDGATRKPVSDATVTVAVDTGSARRRPVTAKIVDDRYEALVPRRRGEQWSRWKVDVNVAGPTGRATVSYTPPSGSAPPWLLYVTAALLPLSFAAFILRQRERRLDEREGERHGQE